MAFRWRYSWRNVGSLRPGLTNLIHLMNAAQEKTTETYEILARDNKKRLEVEIEGD